MGSASVSGGMERPPDSMRSTRLLEVLTIVALALREVVTNGMCGEDVSMNCGGFSRDGRRRARATRRGVLTWPLPSYMTAPLCSSCARHSKRKSTVACRYGPRAITAACGYTRFHAVTSIEQKSSRCVGGVGSVGYQYMSRRVDHLLLAHTATPVHTATLAPTATRAGLWHACFTSSPSSSAYSPQYSSLSAAPAPWGDARPEETSDALMLSAFFRIASHVVSIRPLNAACRYGGDGRYGGYRRDGR